ncbi:right-handed parallel beta-helix repeat-containing protein [Mangrovibacterium sp.]|uniref:right-handed parallel beta-helix repeat-containing protein n=1 Tax=Mangrovibacterium sp. TaxID=1961364 RepID=UPI00356B4FA0
MINLIFNGRSTSAVGIPEMEQPGTASLVLEADTVQSSVITVGTSSWSSLAEQDAFIQSSLEAVDADLVFAGYCRLGDQTPEPANKQAYLALDAGTIFGNEVEELQFLVGNGTGFDVLEVAEVATAVITIPSVLSSQLLTSEIDYKAEESGIAETSGTTTAFSYSVIPGQERDSLTVVQGGDADYSVLSSGTTALLSVAYEKGDEADDANASKLTVLNQRAGNNVKVVSQSYVEPEPEVVPEGFDFGMEGTYFVSSSTGSDSNDGLSADRPKKTLAAVTALNPKAGQKVALKASDAFEETLTVPTSGSAGNPIVYGAYGIGEKPVISGTAKVTGWEKYSGNIYRTKVSSAVTQLFVDGEFLLVSRYPQNGYYSVTSGNGRQSFTSNDISTSINYAGSMVYHKPNDWTLKSALVSSSSGNTVTADLGSYSYKANYGVFFVNNLDFMTYSGSWCYDSSNNYIYLWMPDSSNPSNHSIEVSVRKCIDLSSRSYVTIENLNVQKSNSIGIYQADNTGSNITINNCVVNYSCDHGIYLGVNSDYATISDCQINYCGRDGVYTDQSDYVTVTRNTIVSCGMIDYMGMCFTKQQEGSGIKVRGAASGTSLIAYNKITNSGSNGIMGSGTVEYNYLDGACLTIDDGGGFYASGNNSIVRYNIIKNVLGTEEGEPAGRGTAAYGIYFDDNVSGSVATNNVIHKCGHGGIYLHNTTNCSATNNLVFDAQSSILVRSSSNSGNQVTGNTIVKTYEQSIAEGGPRLLEFQLSSTISACDNNIFYSEGYVASFSDNNGATRDIALWTSRNGFDSNSEYYRTNIGTPELYYNETDSEIFVPLNGVYYDVDGALVSSFKLRPFTGRAVIKAN